MKKLNLIYFILNIFVLSTCEKEDEHRDYPRVVTHKVTNINSDGATFTGQIIKEGNSEIIDHGFVWGNNPLVNIDSDYKFSLGKKSNYIFKKTITFDLVPEKNYYLKK